MRLQGDSFRKIARTLNAEKVPTPMDLSILRSEVYVGHMGQNKTDTVSYKNHKQVEKPKEEWSSFLSSHKQMRAERGAVYMA